MRIRGEGVKNPKILRCRKWMHPKTKSVASSGENGRAQPDKFIAAVINNCRYRQIALLKVSTPYLMDTQRG